MGNPLLRAWKPAIFMVPLLATAAVFIVAFSHVPDESNVILSSPTTSLPPFSFAPSLMPRIAIACEGNDTSNVPVSANFPPLHTNPSCTRPPSHPPGLDSEESPNASSPQAPSTTLATLLEPTLLSHLFYSHPQLASQMEAQLMELPSRLKARTSRLHPRRETTIKRRPEAKRQQQLQKLALSDSISIVMPNSPGGTTHERLSPFYFLAYLLPPHYPPYPTSLLPLPLSLRGGCLNNAPELLPCVCCCCQRRAHTRPPSSQKAQITSTEPKQPTNHPTNQQASSPAATQCDATAADNYFSASRPKP